MKHTRKPQSVTRIDRLTPAQEALLPVWRDKWIKIGLSTEPADRQRVEKALRKCYDFAGLDGGMALKVRWVESPAQMATAVRSAVDSAVDSAIGSAVRSAVYSAVRSAVYSAIGSAVDSAIGSAVDSAVDSAIGSAVYSAVRSAVGSAIGSAVDSAIGSAVRSAVRSAVDSAVDSAIGSAVDSAVRSAVRSAVDSAVYSAYHGGQTGAAYAAWIDFFYTGCGLRLPTARLRSAYAQLNHAGPMLLFKQVAICVDRPRAIRLRESRLHAESNAALEWRDGTGIYAWRGTVVPAEWITQKATIDPRIALTHPNVERRRCLAEILGWDRVLDQVRARVVQEDSDPQIGTLLQADLPDAPNSRFLRVLCGTGRSFVLPVPSDLTTARQAQAWMWNLPDAGAYHPEIRT